MSITLHRGIAVPAARVPQVVARIRAVGIDGTEGQWRFRVPDPCRVRGQLDALFSKPGGFKPMTRKTAWTRSYAVVRVEHGMGSSDPSDSGPDIAAGGADITVKEVVLTLEEAKREVARLNAIIRKSDNTKYYWQGTHLFLDGGSHGSTDGDDDAVQPATKEEESVPSERRLISRVGVGRSSRGEPDGLFLIYAMGDRMALVVTSRENGDAEVILDRAEADKVANEIHNARDQLLRRG